jgi:hypothetical protein
MKRINIKTIGLTLAYALLMGTLCACSDELDWSGNQRVEEGLPATVNLKLVVNDMGVRSRTIAEEDAANYCDNIWIGFYSAEDGSLKDKFYLTSVADTEEKVETEYALSVKTQSVNNVYIVAVANSDVNMGVSEIGKYGVDESESLHDMLDAADTYDKFKAICLLRPDATDVNVYANTLTMSGWYANTQNGDSYTDPTKVPVVNIQAGENNLDGAIYLRRVISFNKFIIVPGDNINLSLNTWKVCNVPAGCYLFEQADNISDHYSGSAKFFNSTLASRLFSADKNAKGESGKSFEFYQVENKRDAVDYASIGTGDHVGIDKLEGESKETQIEKWYNEREREFKTAKSDGSSNVDNTGIYKSLVASANGDLSNNNASYVVINADIDYYYSYYKLNDDGTPTTDLSDPATAEPVADDFAYKKVHRTANINYTIHLGYCEDQNSDGTPTYETATDFNCRRNTKYLYNVRINGVNKVVVEATSTDENQPGTDGWVSDETGEFERLDSHYCEFNICLTDKERKSMGYRITAPYDGKYYYYSRNQEGKITETEGMNEELHTWIKFYPTRDENTLAEYNGGKGSNSLGEGNGLWTFNDMCAPDVKASPYASDSESDPDNTERWYTVFVDEYVYHFDDKGNKETSWPYYCNQDDRLAEFIMHDDKSTDLESEYSYCKYAFSQKSIQTYYKGSNVGDRAIGVEHFEETYCLNMNWDWQWSNNPNYNHVKERKYDWVNKCEYDLSVNANAQLFYDFTNGRYNQWNYIDGTVNGRTTKTWSDVIQQKVPGHVSSGSNNYCSHPDADYPVYMPKPAAGVGKPDNSPSPKDNNVYYANSICMNRNRDLNGDNVITPDEVKWYLPTSSDMIQIGICQGELPDPLIRFTDYDPYYFAQIWDGISDPKYYYGVANFHYVTSDVQYFWAEECVTTGDNVYAGYFPTASQAYTVRCVRNLGTDNSVTPQYGVNEVDNAFSYNEDTRTFNQNNFRDEQLRGYTVGGLAPHSVADVASHPYKKFQVAKKFCIAKDSYISFNNTLSYPGGASNDYTRTQAWTNSLKKNGICGQYYEMDDQSDKGTWRIPSSGELALMWIEGLTMADGSYLLSASYGYFVGFDLRNYTDNNHLYLGYHDADDREVLAMDCLGKSPTRLRCVRDVR